MKPTHIKITRLEAVLVLAVCAFGAYAAESQEATPAPINKDQIKGRVDEAKGAAKEVAGKVLDDKGMEVEGNIQKNVGKTQAGYGDLKRDIQQGK